MDYLEQPRVVHNYPFLDPGEGMGIDIGLIEFQEIFEPSDYFRDRWIVE